MTLRQFVELGTVGTRAERQAFEDGMVQAHARFVEMGIPIPPHGTWMIDMDADHSMWAVAFQFMQTVK